MRKFFSKDFNDVTNYIKRKRFRGNEYYVQCLDQYLLHRFPEIYSSVLNYTENLQETCSVEEEKFS